MALEDNNQKFTLTKQAEKYLEDTQEADDEGFTVVTGRRGGKTAVPPSTPSAPSRSKSVVDTPGGKCMCKEKSDMFFCRSKRCQNDPMHRSRTVVSPDRRPSSPLMMAGKPKLTKQEPATKGMGEFEKVIPKIMKDISKMTNIQILKELEETAKILDMQQKTKYWMSDDGQAELLRRIDHNSASPPGSKDQRWAKSTGVRSSLNVFDYTEESKALLCSTGAAAADGEEWVEVELTADTGACDTVIPKAMCPHIPIQPSLQSLRCLEYEVASGATIKNLGERRCLMWTENASEARHINMQVADVHKALLSLSRCADMGFESRFGRVAGALIDEVSGEVVPLLRKGNLYV